MTSRNADIARFDAYLFGEMTDRERMDFEKALSTDTTLRAAFEEHRRLAEELATGAQYTEITDQLRSIHHSLYSKPKPLFKNPKFLVPLAVAAVLVIGILAVRPLMGTDTMGSAEEAYAYETSTDTNAYTEDISEAQVPADVAPAEATMLTDDLLEPVSSEMIGTAFMTGSGYFVTATHGLADGDHFILQNNKKATFEVTVIYRDEESGVAILQCHPAVAERLEPVSFYLTESTGFSGDTVLVVNSRYKSGFEPGRVVRHAGYSYEPGSFGIVFEDRPPPTGTPVFGQDGQLLGMIVNNREDNHIYVLGAPSIRDALEKAGPGVHHEPGNPHIVEPALSIEQFEPLIFEIHP